MYTYAGDMTDSHQQRTHRRTDLRTSTPVLDSGNGRFCTGHCRNLSRGGIFVEMPSAPPIGAVVDVFIGGVGLGPRVLARVVRVVPGVGFAGMFTSDTSSLDAVLTLN
jgi:hypothetical protein